MSPERTAFENWKKMQTFYREQVLEYASFYNDGHGNLIVWHDELGVLKTIPIPQEASAE